MAENPFGQGGPEEESGWREVEVANREMRELSTEGVYIVRDGHERRCSCVA